MNNYGDGFILNAAETRADTIFTQTYKCRDRFVPSGPRIKKSFAGTLVQEPGFSIKSVELDHGITSLGFLLDEKFHINIKKEGLKSLGLEPGPWIGEFKRAIFDGACPGSLFEAKTKKNKAAKMPLKKLSEKIAIISPGQKIVYVTDTGFNSSNRERIIDFAKNADHLFIEAAFLEKDAELAKKKRHLTANQAGFIAGKAGAKRFTLFHFSPRYAGMADIINDEARNAYKSRVDLYELKA